ncbi:hypothetical protein [Staphylococcus epidermidis]|uniref:hypothetical protein n=1 Tax=Staphylococcus epidermidis TaxID=1282 RepID=UPI0016433EC3|nr:hypothetical protein [Staphylococcus epidermidis]
MEGGKEIINERCNGRLDKEKIGDRVENIKDGVNNLDGDEKVAKEKRDGQGRLNGLN